MTIANQDYAVNASAPTQIYPYGNQQALTIRNTGSVAVFVSPVPALTGGTEISPGRSLGWEAETALYAYTATSVGTVQVITANVSGQDSLAISGIDTPVYVQGGGEYIGSTTIAPFTIPLSWEIPAASNGVDYPTLVVRTDFSASMNYDIGWSVTDASGNIMASMAEWLANAPVAPNYAFGVGPLTHFIPLWGEAPYTFAVSGTDPGTTQFVTLAYSTQLLTAPQTDLSPLFGVQRVSPTAGAGRVVYFPATFTPYYANLYTTTAVTATNGEAWNGSAWVGRGSGELSTPLAAGGTVYQARVDGGGFAYRMSFDNAAQARIWPTLLK